MGAVQSLAVQYIHYLPTELPPRCQDDIEAHTTTSQSDLTELGYSHLGTRQTCGRVPKEAEPNRLKQASQIWGAWSSQKGVIFCFSGANK